MSSLPLPDPAPRLVAVSDVAARPVDWLWPDRLGLGKLSVLDGDPGLGKSLVALDFCARLSTGRPWPDGRRPRPTAASIYLNGEDGVEDTIRPRLAALGADLTRVFIVERGDGEPAVPLSLPAQTDALEALVARAPGAAAGDRSGHGVLRRRREHVRRQGDPAGAGAAGGPRPPSRLRHPPDPAPHQAGPGSPPSIAGWDRLAWWGPAARVGWSPRSRRGPAGACWRR